VASIATTSDIVPAVISVLGKASGLLARPTSGDAKLPKLRGDRLALVRGANLLVDVENAAVGSDIKSPSGSKRLILVHHAVGFGDLLRRITQQREVDAERLRKRLIDVRWVDANRKIGDIECADVIATLTE
jgi:hypothetical protein